MGACLRACYLCFGAHQNARQNIPPKSIRGRPSRGGLECLKTKIRNSLHPAAVMLPDLRQNRLPAILQKSRKLRLPLRKNRIRHQLKDLPAVRPQFPGQSSQMPVASQIPRKLWHPIQEQVALFRSIRPGLRRPLCRRLPSAPPPAPPVSSSYILPFASNQNIENDKSSPMRLFDYPTLMTCRGNPVELPVVNAMPRASNKAQKT